MRKPPTFKCRRRAAKFIQLAEIRPAEISRLQCKRPASHRQMNVIAILTCHDRTAFELLLASINEVEFGRSYVIRCRR
jgi:hypothetical protein